MDRLRKESEGHHGESEAKECRRAESMRPHGEERETADHTYYNSKNQA